DVDADVELIEIELASVRPDAAHAGNFAVAQRKGEVTEVGVGGRGDPRPRFAALPFDGFRLLEPGRPDQVAANAHRPVDARDRLAFLGEEGSWRTEPGPLDAAMPLQRRLIDGVARHRAGRRADRAADRPKDAAEERPGCLQDDCCHGWPDQLVLSGKAKTPAIRRRHCGTSGETITTCPS